MKTKSTRIVIIISVLCVHVKCDSGTPLFLSPFIENGTIEIAKSLSEVNSSYMLNIKSYSGFITVNKEFDSNIWFWYFPVEGGHVEDSPLVIWLQGGPMISSMFSLFQGVGPLYYKCGKLTENQFSWHKNQSMLFVDNPIGAGFSFTGDDQGYSKNQSQISENLYTFLVQFLQLFPELQPVPLFLTGQSYAGKHIPSFAYEIHTRNPTAKMKINLKGMAIGNGWIEPLNLFQISELLFNLGFADSDLTERLRNKEKAVDDEVKRGNWTAVKERHLDFLISVYENVHIKSLYNYITDDVCYLSPSYLEFIEIDATREALHVGDKEYNWQNSDAKMFLLDQMQGVKPLMEVLLEEYAVMLYSGQFDLMVPYVNSEKIYRSFNWSHAQEYKARRRYPLQFKGKIEGYQKLTRNFSEISIRNAGHCVGLDKPELLSYMISFFTHNFPI